ncbi:transglutaminase elicitor, putative [Phytophthora infestans T30-4]|uniref:Transglutaminase elicitor, putative n=1 Tax=Phytophthora infestans (strain T30-4) TaxID=403677 RepID=D0NUH0_PHYIT|nr:transglutaminase elicitor, putative [Phytophthora infestans T30-4]EEY65316.1 transglutaminase elicitor, putative [Phytophthora infestans T30-4]|eukprot:XP_002897179.1 transglutaminase elicitor, putative [Phytophthora infestans T30-4]
MVFSPSTYLVSAAVAVVALQMQHASAASLYYGVTTVSKTADTISKSSPFAGGEVPDQDCAIEVEVDPTLPDITTISTVPVTYPELLANLTTPPTEPVHTKVGTVVLSAETPNTDADQDAYITSGSPTQGSTEVNPPATKTGTSNVTAAPSKTGTTTDTTTPSTVKGGAKPKDCATGWEEPATATRKLRDSVVSGHDLEENLEKKRRLEAYANKDIAKLEAYFGTKMEMTLKDLPTQGVFTPAPWPAPYWPTYQDSINVVWSQGQPSPAEKYAKAFGLDVKEFMDKVSKDNGVDSGSKRKQCQTDEGCESLNNGSKCAIRDGKSSGYCIPAWFGICHAWAPAAILEAEPTCPVTYNGVTFQPLDIKGLISNVYDGAGVATVFTGARYNGGDDGADEYGRHTNAAYRDLNPAYFHIASANILGKLNATFVADVDAAAEVWNQPVRGFKVYEQTAMSLEEAAQTFYGLEEYPWNAAAKSIVYVKSRLSWIFETYTDGGLVSSGEVDRYTTGKYYYYLLELDDAGEIIGGEWVYSSDSDHPDFLWFAKSKPAADMVTSIGLSYADVSMLLKKSVACSDSASASGSAGSSSASASASAATSTSGSVGASTSGSATSSASTSTGSTTDVPFTSSTASNGGSAATEVPATEAPATEAPATETPVATTQNGGATTAPASTTAPPAATTATPSNNGGNQGGNNGGNNNQNDNHYQQYQQQQQQQQQQFENSDHPRQWYQSFFHWW